MNDNNNSIREHNKQIRNEIRRLYNEERLTLSQISARFNGVNKRYLSELIRFDDKEPHPKAANQLGWIKYVKIPVCPVHGVVHVGKCPGTSKPKKPRQKRTPGGWVNAKDPAKAAQQIMRRAEYSMDDLITEIVKEVLKGEEHAKT